MPPQMTIAVNTRYLVNGQPKEYGDFLHQVLHRMVKKHPEYMFIFIFDRPYEKTFVFEKNVTPVVTGPAVKGPLLRKFWYDIKLPAVLRRYKADVFLSCDGACSLRARLPQCIVVEDLAFLHYPSFFKKAEVRYHKKYTSRFLNKAAVIATLSEFSKKDIAEQYKIATDKINVIGSAAKEIFRPMSSEEKSLIKEKYTAGKEYFVYSGLIHPRKNLMNLLKAFSVFKKRQKTNMKLVLAGALAPGYGSFAESLKSYKYRDDVVLTGRIEEAERARITAAGWGLIYPSLAEGFGIPVAEAMQCGVPVITSAHSAMQEITKGAGLYVDAGSHTAIADKMMLLYKDEKLRQELAEKGREVVKAYSWDNTATLLWQSILKAAAQKGPQ